MALRNDDTPAPPPRVSTGIPRLDLVLHGGLLRGSSYAVFGPPGSGKTVLASQLAFHRAAQGDRVVYFTLLSESHARLVSHLSNLDFFDLGLVGERLQYLSGYRALEQGGLEGLLTLLRGVLRKDRPNLLVVDGAHALEAFADGAPTVRRFVQELQTITEMADCTTLLLHISARLEFPASSAVDGLIGLDHRLVGPRAVRELTVHKLRGSGHLLGRHELGISRAGVEIHPRLEVRPGASALPEEGERRRLAFGLPGLDRMLDGGLPTGSTTTLLGAPGSGKTLLGLQFLVEGARQGTPGLYFGFYETPSRLPAKAEAVGIDLRTHLESGLLQILWEAPLEGHIDALAERILEPLEAAAGQGHRRLVIDDLDGFRRAAVHPDRMGLFVSALAHRLRVLDVTSLLLDQTPVYDPALPMPTSSMAAAVENVVFLRYAERRARIHRLLSILKMRDSGFEATVRAFGITKDGLSIGEPFADTEAPPDAPGGRA